MAVKKMIVKVAKQLYRWYALIVMPLRDGEYRMLIPYNSTKALQASAVLLKHSPFYRMTRMRLLKLLYIADRQRIAKTGRPITGDEVAAMDHGPVLSSTYNLIKGEHPDSATWEKFIICEGKRDLHLIADPGDGKLSTPEINLLGHVWHQFRHFSDSQLREYAHDFPEYKKNAPPPQSRNMIPVDDVIDAVGLGEKRDLIKAAADAETHARRLFDAYR